MLSLTAWTAPPPKGLLRGDLSGELELKWWKVIYFPSLFFISKSYYTSFKTLFRLKCPHLLYRGLMSNLFAHMLTTILVCSALRFYDSKCDLNFSFHYLTFHVFLSPDGKLPKDRHTAPSRCFSILDSLNLVCT
jgi:hypothetical protein